MRRKNHLFILLVVCILLPSTYALNSESFKWELRISVEKTDIRMEPDIKSAVVTTVTKGSILISYEKAGEWFRVITADEAGFVVIGYIHSSGVEIISEKSTQEPDYWKEEPDFFKGIGLSIKLTGGLNYFSGGDIDKGTRGFYGEWQTSIKPLNIGLGITADIIFNINSQIGIGVGVGNISATRRDFGVTKISTVPLRVGLFYTLPIHPLFNISFNGGTALYLTKYSCSLGNTWEGMEEIYHNARANGIGFNGAIGFEINLTSKSTFFIEGQVRYAKITNFKGTEKLKKSLYDPYSIEEGTLYYLEGERYPSLAILEEEPSGYKTARKAIFDFSGFTFQAGMRIKF